MPLCELSLRTRCLHVCTCVRACLPVCVCVRVCAPRYDRCNWRFSAPSLIGLRIGLRRDCRHWWGRYATTCACPRGGAGTCVQWTSSVVLSSVLSSVLRPRHNRAMRIALLQGCQGACHHPTTASAAGEPARRRRRAPQEPLLLRAKTLENSLLLGSFLGRIFTIWRPEFSHFHKAQYIVMQAHSAQNRARARGRYHGRPNWRFSAPSLIGLRIGLRRDCRHWWGRYATTCACPRGGAGTCVQWTSSVVLSSVLSSVLRTRHNRAMRIALLQGTCHHPTTASAAGGPTRRRRRALQ